MAISAKIMCQDALECLGWPYVSPGSNNSSGIDCSGLFVYLFRKQGASIYHGSNTIWREYTTSDRGRLTSKSQLKPGFAVFKNRAWRESDSGNRWYKKDNWGNMYHIGLVRSVNPLVIEHATSAGKRCVVEQDTLKGWTYYAALKNVNYGSAEPEKGGTLMQMVVNCPAGETVKLRESPSTKATVVTKIPAGTIVSAEDAGDTDWLLVDWDGKTGYMMRKFLLESDVAQDGSTVSIDLPESVALTLRDALLTKLGVG